MIYDGSWRWMTDQVTIGFGWRWSWSKVVWTHWSFHLDSRRSMEQKCRARVVCSCFPTISNKIAHRWNSGDWGILERSPRLVGWGLSHKCRRSRIWEPESQKLEKAWDVFHLRPRCGAKNVENGNSQTLWRTDSMSHFFTVTQRVELNRNCVFWKIVCFYSSWYFTK